MVLGSDNGIVITPCKLHSLQEVGSDSKPWGRMVSRSRGSRFYR